MPLYPMQCALPTFEEAQEKGAHSWCGHTWDWFARLGVYKMSEQSSFRGVLCPRCGRHGAMRIYPADSTPNTVKCQGTWGAEAPPQLRGKTFLNKDERDEQLATFCDRQQMLSPDDERGEFTRSAGPKKEAPKKKERDWVVTVEAEPEEVKHEDPGVEEVIHRYLVKKGPTRRLTILADHEEMNPHAIQRVLQSSKSVKKVRRGIYEAVVR